MTGSGAVITLTGVTVRHGGLVALDDVRLGVDAGERIALVGSSGAGKTSLLEVLAGLVVPDVGTVDVLGADPGRLRRRDRRAHGARVGLVSQHLDLALPLRVVHNVNAGLLGRWGTAAALWSLARPSGRHEVCAVLNRVGLADRVDDRVDQLSGGERQRVAVARVLRQDPDLVLADEPTSSVDPRLSDTVMAALCDRSCERTVIVSAHDPELARRHVDRFVGLQGGRVAFDAPASDVSPGDLADLYGQ